MDHDELQQAVLELITTTRRGLEIFRGESYLDSIIRSDIGANVQVDQFMAAIWALVARELAYINIAGRQQGWGLWPTSRGELVAGNEIPDPFSPDFLWRMDELVPEMTDDVRFYLTEAVETFRSHSYTASAVMLGVASEAAFLEMAEAFTAWIGDGSNSFLRKVLDNPKDSFARKFSVTRNAMLGHEKELQTHVSGRLDITLNGVADLIRMNRNDAGHPTGTRISKEEQRAHLQVFANYLSRVYTLKQVFRDEAQNKV